MLLTLFLIVAYLFGSVNFAILLCKLFRLPDPRQQGSGNPGATNALRIGGRKLALLVILGDVLKGIIPVVLARYCQLENMPLAFVALAAIIGHIYPLFFKFKGGKGIATMLGAILALTPLVGLIVIATWLLIAILFRFSSLASIIATIALPIYCFMFQQIDYILPMTLLTLLVIYRHKGNIQRLIKKTEPKIGKKS